MNARLDAHQATCEQLDELLRRLASRLDEIPDGDPIPLTDRQVDRIRLAINVFSGLRVHRYVIYRLGIGPTLDRPMTF